MADLEARVRRLEDREAIWQLFIEYRRHLDARDFAAYAQLFTEDGEWFGNIGKATGPAEIEAMLHRTLEIYADDSTRTHHLVANPVIDVDGDRATAESTWVYITHDGVGNPVLSLLGHYRDVLTRKDGVWKFLRREAYLDFPYEVLDTTK